MRTPPLTRKAAMEREGRMRGNEDSSGCLPLPGCPIEERHIEAALRHCAFFIMQYGDALVPLFERLESDLVAAQRRRSPTERARALLAAHTLDGGTKAIR